jgi:hypothetical protein
MERQSERTKGLQEVALQKTTLQSDSRWHVGMNLKVGYE